MITIFGKTFWQIVIDLLAGPKDAKRPVLILVVEDDAE